MGSDLTSSLAVVSQRNILIYAGPGAGKMSIHNTESTIKQLVGNRYNVATVDSDTLRAEDWMRNTALLIMPGGADRPYLAKLGGVGNQNIKKYVANGGKYLGICAGAYYSADRIEFAKGDPELEVTGIRELKFFPGLVSGPTYTGYDHRDTTIFKGTRAAKLIWQQQEPFAKNKVITVFYNGGGSFVDAEKYPNVTVLARYNTEESDAKEQPAAIVECSVGKGSAILSGPHFEWDPATLDTVSVHLVRIKPELEKSNSERLELAQHLLQRLGIP